jgi:ribonuclease BN (tRNA processing enzyme)
MQIKLLTVTTVLFFTLLSAQVNATCADKGVWLQVLGSGGPELGDGRASSGYLLWNDGKARVLIDVGSGSLFRFEQSGASLNDLDAILLSHFHVDHSADLPSLIKASYFSGRDRDLPLFVPMGNSLMPSATEFVQGLFGDDGAFRYLSDYLDGSESYRLLPNNVTAMGKKESIVRDDSRYRLTAVPVHHGPIPALAWKVELAGRTIVFSGDMNNANETVVGLANGVDLFVAHNAVTDGAGRIARNLHMTPLEIGKIAARAKVKKLLLSHRMNRTLGNEAQTLSAIKLHYNGSVAFADDLQCFAL